MESNIDPDEAQRMLDFVFSQMYLHSPDMGGNHIYKFLSSGWPMTHCKGPTAIEAVRAAMAEVERATQEADK